MEYGLICTICKSRYDSVFGSQICKKCHGILEVEYKASPKKVDIRASKSFWDFESVLPNGDYKHYIVGGTRLVRGESNDNVYMKIEPENPTRSFKDRGSVIEIAKALEYGYSEIVCASTGNMAYSLAYYSKIAGIKAKIFMGEGANQNKVAKIKSVGSASVHIINGDFTKAEDLAKSYAEKHDAFLTGDYCYREEGQKTISYEVMGQLPDVTHIIIPVGNATLISGMFKGLVEMVASGTITRMPRLIAVQASGSDSVVEAFRSGSNAIKYMKPKTKADAIAVGLPKFGLQTLDAINKTGGSAISVTDAEMERMQHKFYEEFGMVAELGGVASLAALEKMRLSKKDRAVAIISGANV